MRVSPRAKRGVAGGDARAPSAKTYPYQPLSKPSAESKQRIPSPFMGEG